MKIFIVLAAFVAAAYAASISHAEVMTAFEDFKAEHGKSYDSEEEEAHRMAIFKENLVKVEEHNARFDRGEVSFTVGITKFSDMLPHEVAPTLDVDHVDTNLEKKNVHKRSARSIRPWGKLVDWREHGYVTSVKHQHQCDASWSFSAIGAIEGQYFKKTGHLIDFSVQNIVDCSQSYGNTGCGKGSPKLAMAYILAQGGISTESSYPYIGREGVCNNATETKDIGIYGYNDIYPNEEDLEHAVAIIGPISVRIDGSHWSFQHYESGVFYEPKCSPTKLSHAGVVVGFGVEQSGEEYWIVKNSWGQNWGEAGYIKMARNRDNNCGIATEAVYPML